MGKLKALRETSFAANNLKGPVPKSIFELKGLTRLNVRLNEFSGLVELEVKFETDMPQSDLVY